MNKISLLSLILSTLILPTSSFADVLTLKDGQQLKGTLVSRDANGVVFELGGQKLTFKSENIEGISLDGMASKSTTNTSSTQQVSKDKQSTKEVVAPIGSKIVVRTDSAINSKQHKAGYKFTARLEADLVVDNKVVAARGTRVYGMITSAKKSGRLVGKSELQLTFTDILLNNQMKPISTSLVNAITEGSGKKTVGTTARSAAIGGLINGSKGAKDGAKVGLGLSLLSSGNSINIPAGTMLEFTLAAPLAVK